MGTHVNFMPRLTSSISITGENLFALEMNMRDHVTHKSAEPQGIPEIIMTKWTGVKEWFADLRACTLRWQCTHYLNLSSADVMIWCVLCNRWQRPQWIVLKFTPSLMNPDFCSSHHKKSLISYHRFCHFYPLICHIDLSVDDAAVLSWETYCEVLNYNYISHCILSFTWVLNSYMFPLQKFFTQAQWTPESWSIFSNCTHSKWYGNISVSLSSECLGSLCKRICHLLGASFRTCIICISVDFWTSKRRHTFAKSNVEPLTFLASKAWTVSASVVSNTWVSSTVREHDLLWSVSNCCRSNC